MGWEACIFLKKEIFKLFLLEVCPFSAKPISKDLPAKCRAVFMRRQLCCAALLFCQKAYSFVFFQKS